MDDASMSDQLRRLADQHRAGTMDDAEYAAAKSALLGNDDGTNFAQETLVLRRMDHDVSEPIATSRYSLVGLLVAVGLVVGVLAVIIAIWPR